MPSPDATCASHVARVKIHPPHAFGAVLVAAMLPFSVRQTRVSGTVTDDGVSLWTILVHDVGVATDGWMIVLLILSAIAGVVLAFAPMQPAGKRFASIICAALGLVMLIAASGPLFRGERLWVSYGPGVGFWLVGIAFLGAGILAIRGKVKP